MTATTIYLASKEDISAVIRDTLIEIEKERKSNQVELFSINEVRKRLGMAHATVKKLVRNGTIKVTGDGKITEAAINDYLQNLK